MASRDVAEMKATKKAHVSFAALLLMPRGGGGVLPPRQGCILTCLITLKFAL